MSGELSESTTESTPTNIYHSSRIKDRRSIFVAHAKRVETKQEVDSFLNHIKIEEKNATHNVLAFRLESSDGTIIEESDDDGEKHAGERVLNLLKTLDAKNVAVIVTRWFGGISLGPVRFEHIVKCAREVLDQGPFLSKRGSTSSTSSSTRSISSNTILVNGCQRGNPILQFIRNVPWEYSEIVPDYLLGQTTCALFLSLKYHRLHPEYIFNRMEKVAHQYILRILLILVDIESHQESIRELTKLCIVNNFTIILAWSQEEAGRYLETYKMFEYKSPEMIMEKVENDYLAKLTHCLTQIRSVNKTDVVTLSSSFGSLKRIMNASSDELAMCPGLGEQKIKRIKEAFEQPFLTHKNPNE
ncbi:DNA repair protein rad10 [Gigaspora margarita]|uniref:DNA excision repair protein ERCC-1 n=1 Tax=Gigaspora margarita TaxID=4874 RepID=A0A8H3XBM0_GIGMA|nr:DNA repair protein rad10 [Gigaspora margarita]